MEENNISSGKVIIADGNFPYHVIPLGYLKNASEIICCDGSAENTVKAGFIPDAIVGDMDSLSQELHERFSDRIFRSDDKETNDLTKAVNWCTARVYNDLVIVGATGKREDHTIGNISLLAEYIKIVKVKMITDTGIFIPLVNNSVLASFPGQQISIFSIDTGTKITTRGLKYPLNNVRIKNWWMATLNEAEGDEFSIEFDPGPLIIYLKFR